MKLVRISEDAIIDIDDVQFAIWDDAKQEVRIEFKSTDTLIYTEDKKVLDTICGSEEQNFIGYKRLKNKDLVQKVYVDANNRQDNHYSIIINSDNAGAKAIVTESEVLSLLNQLKTDETLTIKRT